MFSKRPLISILSAVIFIAALATSGLSRAEVVDKVLVIVNDEVVTQREFDRTFKPIEMRIQQTLEGEEMQQQLEAARKGILEQLVNTKLAISLAKEEKIEIDEEGLKKRIERIKSFYGTEEEFLQALSLKGTNLTEFERELREQMLAQKFIEKEVASNIVIPPGDIKDLYEKNKEKLVAPKRVKVRGIMTRKEGAAAGGGGETKMKEIIVELDKGADFASVATEMSEGPYAKNGGDMGYVEKGQFLEELDAVIFSMGKDERSDIVESRIGYHVFLVEDINEPRQLELNEVSDFLREQLFAKRFEENIAEWVGEKRKNAYISYK